MSEPREVGPETLDLSGAPLGDTFDIKRVLGWWIYRERKPRRLPRWMTRWLARQRKRMP